jgi:hypothetical protein
MIVATLVISGCCCCTNTTSTPQIQPSYNSPNPTTSSPTAIISTSPPNIPSSTVKPTTIKTSSGHDASLDKLVKEYKSMIYGNYEVKSYSEVWWDSTNSKMTIGVDWPTDTVDIYMELIDKNNPSKELIGDAFILKFNSNEEANAFITDGSKWHGYTVNNPTDTKNALTVTQTIKTSYEPLSGFKLYERTFGQKPSTLKIYENIKNPTQSSMLVNYFVEADNIVIESEMLEMDAW